jgi:hypothetical protein
MSMNVYGGDRRGLRRGDNSLGPSVPVRSGDPERDWYLENRAASEGLPPYLDRRQLRRMSWRAGGAQDYPGGALETLLEASHRGKGPKNYRRSDELLREILCERLTEDPFIDAVDVSVDVENGEVTLTGTVTSRLQKMRTEDLVADSVGVTEIHNMLAVRSDEIENRMSGL